MSITQMFVIVNVVGGTAVLGSYVLCLLGFPEHREALWGGIDGRTRLIFTLSMVLAAGGYLTFCYMVVFDDFGLVLFSGAQAFNTAIILVVLFLISSSLWMPFTILYLNTGERVFWILCVAMLWVTALSLLTLLFSIIIDNSAQVSMIVKLSSILGLGWLTLHCLVLDALIWVIRFNRGMG